MNSAQLQSSWEYLQNYSKIFVACSGGVDSIVLVDLLYKAQFNIHVLHCNYQLRGNESAKDAEFVNSFCTSRNIIFESIVFDTKKEQEKRKKTTQETARELRYEWFEELLTENPNSIICTAHHKDDNREQLLLKLMSSGKITDLSGIQQARKGYYRPLLNLTKFELIHYAQEAKLTWREDCSNAENNYTRNKIRNIILPAMKETDKRTESGIDKALNEINQLKVEINSQIDHLFDELSCEKEFLVENKFWQNQLTIFKELFLVKWMKSAILQYDIEHIFNNSEIGSIVESGNYYVLKEKEGLWFGQHSLDNFQQISLSQLHNSKLLFSNLEISLDKENNKSESCISFPLNKNEIGHYFIRNIETGDTIYSYSNKQNRLVKKIMNDLKKRHFERKKQLILTHQNKPIQLIESNPKFQAPLIATENDIEVFFLNILIKKFAVIKK